MPFPRPFPRRLYLASTSPRRKDLLKRLGVPFEVVVPRFQEGRTTLDPEEECLLFAEGKAASVRDLCPDAWVLGCDTLIDCEGQKLGKPRDTEDAARILSILSGRTHRVLSGVALLDTANGAVKKHVEIGRVTFRTLSTEQIAHYVRTGEPMGKAGAYAVQGLAREKLIETVEGEEEAIIGLPLEVLRKWFGLSKGRV